MTTKVVMEALSPTMEEGRLVEWKKQEGETVAVGDVLAEVETDKAVMELVARAAGTLLKHVVEAGRHGAGVRAGRGDRGARRVSRSTGPSGPNGETGGGRRGGHPACAGSKPAGLHAAGTRPGQPPKPRSGP